MKKRRNRWFAMLLILTLVLSMGLQGATLAFGDTSLGVGVVTTDDKVADDKVKDDDVKDDEVKDDEIKDDEVKDDEVKDDEVKDDEIKDDEVKDDEVKDDEIKDDEVKDDEIKDDEVKDDEIKDDEVKDDEASGEDEIFAAFSAMGAFPSGIRYKEVQNPDNISVDFGTTEEVAKSKLDKAKLVGNGGKNEYVDAQWTIADYDGEKAGTYTAIGIVSKPEGWTNWPSKGVTVTAKVTVKPMPPHLTVSPKTNVAYPGDTVQLTASKYDPDDKYEKIKWSVNHRNIEVDGDGKVKVGAGATPGDYAVRASAEGKKNKDGNISDSAIITVKTLPTVTIEVGYGGVAFVDSSEKLPQSFTVRKMPGSKIVVKAYANAGFSVGAFTTTGGGIVTDGNTLEYTVGEGNGTILVGFESHAKVYGDSYYAANGSFSGYGYILGERGTQVVDLSNNHNPMDDILVAEMTASGETVPLGTDSAEVALAITVTDGDGSTQSLNEVDLYEDGKLIGTYDRIDSQILALGYPVNTTEAALLADGFEISGDNFVKNFNYELVDRYDGHDAAAVVATATGTITVTTNAVIFITADDYYELYVDGKLIGSETESDADGWKTVESYRVALNDSSIVAVRAQDELNCVSGLSVKIVYDEETVVTEKDSNWRLWNVTADTPEPAGWKTASTVTGWSKVTNVAYGSWDAAKLHGADWNEQWVWTLNYDASKPVFDTHVLFRYAAVVNDDEGGGGTGGGGEEPVTYTVTFDSNDGSAVEAITDIEKGGTVTLPTEPTKDGFVFGGWFKDDGTFEIPFTTSTQVDGNITVHAKWNPEEVPFYVHVYYEAPGATGDVPKDDGDYSYGNNVTVKGPGNLAREGYTFAGWKASINFENGISALLFAADKVVEGTVYATGDIFSMDEADVLLTAQWEEKKEEVVVIPRRNNGGRNNNTTTTITPEELPLAVPVVEGASLPTPVEALQQIVEDVVPLGVPVLPKTGEIPATLFYGLGGILAAAGVFLKRK